MRIDYNTYALPSVHHFNSSLNRRASDMAIQHRLGILSQRRFGLNFGNRVACCLTSLALRSDPPRATTDIGPFGQRRTVRSDDPQRIGKLSTALPRVFCTYSRVSDDAPPGDLFSSCSEEPFHLYSGLYYTL